jgi:hypothetical protein
VISAFNDGREALDDEGQLGFAAERCLILVTHNERHFKPLHSAYSERGQEHSGIIVLPATPPLARVVIRLAMLLTWIASEADQQTRLFKWGQLQELIERGQVPPGYNEGDLDLALGR